MKGPAIGVVGIGDLGSKLCIQLLAHGYEVVVFDTVRKKLLQSTEGMTVLDDGIEINLENIKYVGSLDDLLQLCPVVHWAAPASSLPKIDSGSSSNFILHDSVMTNSLKAIDEQDKSDSFIIAHCIMNTAGRVFVSPEFGDYRGVIEQFKGIGLTPHTMIVQYHDRMMAHSQGIFALLIDMGLSRELASWHDQGFLTPSADELYRAVSHRESQWTNATIDSILSNPHISEFVTKLHKRSDDEQN